MSKKICVFMISIFIFLLNFIPQNVYADEKNKSFEDADYIITYTVDDIWNSGYNGRVQITNRSDKVLEDWEIVLSTKNQIVNIWNAEITYQDDDMCILSNKGWNKTISSGESIEWGYTASLEHDNYCVPEIKMRKKITTDISDAYMKTILKSISDDHIDSGESVIIDDAYVISCLDTIEEYPNYARGIYSDSKTKTKNFLVTVLGTDKKVFSITEKVTASFNTYTDGVCITSHSATFTAYNNSYKLISNKQTIKINTWLNTLASGRVEMKIQKGSSEFMIHANATAFSTGKFNLSIDQVY